MDKFFRLKLNHKRKSIWKKVFYSLAVVVVFVTTYMLILPAITSNTTPICGYEEHTHTDDCYSVKQVLVCELEEVEGHIHDENCYDNELVCTLEESEEHTHDENCYEDKLVCELDEIEGHTHTEACYKEKTVLTCTLEEHTHTDECYPTADEETKEEWESTFADVELTGNWNKDVIAIAKTQLGYKESEKNYITNDDGSINGYTRYGAWYGEPYAEKWSSLFVAFCVDYADVDMDYHYNIQTWLDNLSKDNLYYSSDEYTPVLGDIVFFRQQGNDKADHMGLVAEVDGENTIKVIEGDSDKEVKYVTYNMDDDSILGYGIYLDTSYLVAPLALDDSTEVSNQETLKEEIEKGTSFIHLNNNMGVYINSADGDSHGYVEGSITVPSGSSVTLDLNGKTIYQHGTSPLFEVQNGATLTIIDSTQPDETVETVSGDNYGNEATLSVTENTKATLVYYVTKSKVTNTSTGATEETLEKYTITTTGAIQANDQPVFSVSGGTLNIQSGMVRSGTGRAIVQTSGIVNMDGGYICGFTQSSDEVDDTAFGGAVKMTGGSLNLSGGVIVGNSAHNGGAIYAKTSTVNISGTIISGNISNRSVSKWSDHSEGATYRCGGGGIYTKGSTQIIMNGGYITNNIAEHNGYFDGGGGVCLSGTSTMTLTGGYITGNKANGGGGIRCDFGNETHLIITGGHISANVAVETEGGGVSIDNKGTATLTGGYITNNKIIYTPHWGGGGLFCADGATLNLKNALITENSAGGFGGGIAGCPTGHIYLYVTDGCATYNNSDMVDEDSPHFSGSESVKKEDSELCDEFFQLHGHKDYFCALQSTVMGEMLGGGAANWSGSADHEEVKTSEKTDVLSAERVMGLESNLSNDDITAAENAAKVYINGNYSYTHGGGIMCNGNLVVGVPVDIEVPVHLQVQGKKNFISNSGNTVSLKDNKFAFVITDTNGNEVAQGTCDTDGNITFDKQIMLNSEGTFTYYIQEKVPDDSDSDILYDSTQYKMTVTVTKDSGVDWYGSTTKFTYQITNLKVEKQTGNDEWQEVSLNTTTQEGGVTVLPDQEQISFTNVKTDSIDIEVVKKWYNDKIGADSVTVNLYQNDEVFETVELNNSNNWSYTWDKLPTKDDDGAAYQYDIREVKIDGYVTSYEKTTELSEDSITSIQIYTITNTAIEDLTFKLDITKISESHEEVTIEGAKFELLDSDKNKIYFIKDEENGSYTCVEAETEGAVSTVVTGVNGKLILNEIPTGTYVLRETEAPSGYVVIDDQTITLDENTPNYTLELTLKDPFATYVLPETGGIGTHIYTICGISFMLIACVMHHILKRKDGMI